MGANVIHRIIAVRGRSLRHEGDNNLLDRRLSPIPDEIIGKLWIHLPKMGAAVQMAALAAQYGPGRYTDRRAFAVYLVAAKTAHPA
jgi:hypothetical protein